MESDFYSERRKMIERRLEQIIQCCNGEGEDLASEDRENAENTIQQMEQRFHYPKACTGECSAYILKLRYREK